MTKQLLRCLFCINCLNAFSNPETLEDTPPPPPPEKEDIRTPFDPHDLPMIFTRSLMREQNRENFDSLLETDVLQKWRYYDPDVIVDHLEPAESSSYHHPYPHCLAGFKSLDIRSRQPDRTWYLLPSTRDKFPILEVSSSWSDEIIKIEVDWQLAALIHHVWINALFETRYPKTPTGGLEGVEYEFSAFIVGFGKLRGRTWSPRADAPPKWLVALGRKIIDWSEAEDGEKATQRKDIEDISLKILSYINENGKNTGWKKFPYERYDRIIQGRKESGTE